MDVCIVNIGKAGAKKVSWKENCSVIWRVSSVIVQNLSTEEFVRQEGVCSFWLPKFCHHALQMHIYGSYATKAEITKVFCRDGRKVPLIFEDHIIILKLYGSQCGTAAVWHPSSFLAHVESTWSAATSDAKMSLSEHKFTTWKLRNRNQEFPPNRPRTPFLRPPELTLFPSKVSANHAECFTTENKAVGYAIADKEGISVDY